MCLAIEETAVGYLSNIGGSKARVYVGAHPDIIVQRQFDLDGCRWRKSRVGFPVTFLAAQGGRK